MDSGSYTKELGRRDIETYARLIVRLGERCTWYAAPDCIGNQHKSNENYCFLLSLLPEQLHHRILWVYQQSSPLRYLHEGLEQHPRIGVGGLVPLLKNRDRAYHIVNGIASVIGSQAEVVRHYFGLTSREIIMMLHQHHARFSVDSTTWLSGVKYGVLINEKGKQRASSEGGYDFTARGVLEQNVRTMRKWVEMSILPKQVDPFIQSSLFDDLSA